MESRIGKPTRIMVPHSPNIPLANVDGYGHEPFANDMVRRLERLPVGSVVALRGRWGRGKTDVIGRVVQRINDTDQACSTDTFHHALYFSPWQQPDPDPLSGLLAEITSYILLTQGDNTDKRQIAKLVVGAARLGSALFIAHCSQSSPGLEHSVTPVDHLLATLGEHLDSELQTQSDKLGSPATQFAKLIETALSDAPSGARLLVCVDDIDRCLPGRQVAALEAIHLLSAAKSRANFLVAIDPVSMKGAVTSHFGYDGFDAESYVDKLFDVHQSLDELPQGSVQSWIKRTLDSTINVDGGTYTVRSQLMKHFKVDNPLEQYVSNVTGSILCSPRTISRVCRRLEILAYMAGPQSPLQLDSAESQIAFWFWFEATQHWPSCREVLSTLDEIPRAERMNRAKNESSSAGGYRPYDPEAEMRPIRDAVILRLSSYPELSHVMSDVMRHPSDTGRLHSMLDTFKYLDKWLGQNAI